MDYQIWIWKAAMAALAAFAIAVLIGPSVISYLRRLKFGQSIRESGPSEHRKKAGTPVMGGVIIQIAAIISALLIMDWQRPESEPIFYLIVAMLGFGIIGLLDDYLIVIAKRSLGLKARHKLIGQVLVSILIALYVLSESNGEVPGIIVPYLDLQINLPVWLYIPAAVFVMTGFANAVNITDGLDGLAAGTSSVAFAAYALLCIAIGKPELTVFAGAIVGGCVGFTWFNSHPAQVFMGDTGSLALGGALGALAVMTSTELFLVIIGGMFVIETLSVMIQVTYFRLTGGKRVFRMSPLHHHFELTGWAEPKIVIRFWILALGFAVLGLAGLL